MENIINKISSYNIFTNLFPGVIYCFVSEKFFGVPLIQTDLLIGVFLYYFVGMIISRVSSVVLEPLMKATKFVKFAAYNSYIAASAKDVQIGILLETCNSYRSMISLLTCILLTGAWSIASSEYVIIKTYSHYILVLMLIALFLFAYRKQAQYIVSRVENNEDSTT